MPRCGCDCKNPTIDADSDANDWPCCDAFPDGVPCRYAAIFECGTQLSINAGFDVQQITCPVLELRKECFSGCRYVAATEVANAETCENLPSLTDVTTDSIGGFPPTADTAGVWTRHEGDYRDVVPIATGTICYPEGDWVIDHWTLDIGVDPATLIYTNSWALALLARTAAVYEAVATWDEFGRNTMHLTDATAAEWPELPRRICVVALDTPGINNPCETHEQQCNCCDPGTDTASITGNLSNCGRLSGEVTWTGTRYVSPAALPAGVSYPGSSPCGVFWGTIGSSGDGCDSGGSTWSGEVGLMTYCNGTTWAGNAYCYDTDLEEWVDQGALTLSNVECLCGGVYFDVELPELECCCDGSEPVDTSCCPDNPINRTLTAEGVLTDCTECTGTASGSAIYVEGETYPTWDVDITVCSRTYTIRLVCEIVDGVPTWTATMTDTDPDCGLGLPYTGSFISSACDPLEVIFIWSVSGCCGDIVEAPLLTVTWTE
jgi:hypothetical protein